MNNILRNILAVVAGLIAGSVINFLLISLNGIVIPLPEGADISTMEGLKNSIPLFEFKHFIFPFLGHAVGTLCGAIITYIIAVNQKFRMAMIIGLLFLLGGIINIIQIGGPMWFTVVDIVLAYIPMAWLATMIAKMIKK